MTEDQDLFGKTFDQQLKATGGAIEARDITPNRRIPAEIVFEPTGARVRVSAYADGKLLFQRDDKKTENNIMPKRVQGEVVFEPMGAGVRVTARDAEHKVLWGYVGSKETVSQIHCLVAVYDTLQEELSHELEKRGLINPETVDPLEEATKRLCELQDTLDKLRDCILVQKREDATGSRARQIARIAGDAAKLINLDLSALGPLPQVSKDRAVEIAQRHLATSVFRFADGKPPADWDKEKRETWVKKCWFVSATESSRQVPRLLGIAKKDGAILYDSEKT
ncbi:MAG: hypothetical protein A2498_11120 [Lentisphaerae bacterium RIFOXYC12_FULL_60_16]|nr:MAG: hypothetical protein A2498_11120 [Lentisphaerae bacterium RIFOXYC12_FULL_60_16]